jgi:hypothetical protein
MFEHKLHYKVWLTTTIVASLSNADKWQMGFNSAFKGLINYWNPTCVRCKLTFYLQMLLGLGKLFRNLVTRLFSVIAIHVFPSFIWFWVKNLFFNYVLFSLSAKFNFEVWR